MTTGRVDGLTCQVNFPFGATVMVVSRVSWIDPAHVGVAKVFFSRKVAPAGALPVSTEWVSVFTAFSSASR